jgi:hypothetical protein
MIQDMFIANGDGTYTVRFFKLGVADYVTVDEYLPTDASGRFVYASQGNLYNSPTNELWVALAEKAYAQLNESGWIGQDNTNSYSGIATGFDTVAVTQITGLSTTYAALDFNAMASAFNAGRSMLVSSKVIGIASNVVPGHSYVVTGYDSSAETFTLFNPWGIDGNYLDTNGDGIGDSFKPGTLQLNFNQLVASFDGWSSTTV